MMGLPLLPLVAGGIVGMMLATPVAVLTVALLVAASRKEPHDHIACNECVDRELDAYFKGYEQRKREEVMS